MESRVVILPGKVLFLNWMDTQNPNSGGSELYAFELAKRLSQDRFEVTYLTSSFKGSEPNEKLNGVRIIRMEPADTYKLLLFHRDIHIPRTELLQGDRSSRHRKEVILWTAVVGR